MSIHEFVKRVNLVNHQRESSRPRPLSANAKMKESSIKGYVYDTLGNVVKESGEGRDKYSQCMIRISMEQPTHKTPPLNQAVERLNEKRSANHYIADAAGFISQFIAESEASKYPEYRINEVVSILAEHAVQTGHGELAEDLFNQLAPADKWLLYGTAYEAATLDTNILANWRIALDNDDQANANPMVNAARNIALTEITLHNYRSTDDPQSQQEYQQYAINHKNAIGSFPSHSETAKRYSTRLSIAFARAGLWEKVEEIDQVYPWRRDKAKDKNSQLTCKALAGQLENSDKHRLKKAGTTGEVLLWIDEQRKGIETEKPKVANIENAIQDQALIEELAPDIIKQLGLRPTGRLQKLKILLATDSFEEAEHAYNTITTNPKEKKSTKIQAALLMSKHLYDLQVATVAHEVYGNAFNEELIHIEEWIQRGEVPNKKTLRERLAELEEKTYQLKSPQECILARARLAQIYRHTIPDAYEMKALYSNIRAQWTAFEQQEGNSELLSLLGESLQRLGLQFIKRWKPLNKGGYMGYEPIDPLARHPSLNLTKYGIYEPENMILLWEQAAQELNALLGETRYIVTRHDEVHPISEEDSKRGPQTRRITLHGSWTNYGNYHELSQAITILEGKNRLDTMPEVTNRLDEQMQKVLHIPH